MAVIVAAPLLRRSAEVGTKVLILLNLVPAGGPGPPQTGSGLGLYVVRSLVEAQGGVVTYADRPGGGAAFTVSLANAVRGPASA